MTNRKESDDFLALDVPSAEARERLREQVAGLLHPPIKPWERFLLYFVAFAGLGGTVVCGALAIGVGFELTTLQRLYLALTAFLGGAGTLWAVRTLKQSTHDIARDDVVIRGAVWAFLVVFVCLELFTGQSERTFLTSIMAIVLVGFPMSWDRVKVSELRTRETMLKIALEHMEHHNQGEVGQGGQASGHAPPL